MYILIVILFCSMVFSFTFQVRENCTNSLIPCNLSDDLKNHIYNHRFFSYWSTIHRYMYMFIGFQTFTRHSLFQMQRKRIVESYVIFGADFKNHSHNRIHEVTKALFSNTFSCLCCIFIFSQYVRSSRSLFQAPSKTVDTHVIVGAGFKTHS